MTDILTIDFETEATADLKKTGAAAYAEHPDTRALCMGYVFNTETPAVWNPSLPFPTRVLWHVGCGYPVIAHNAAFEREIWNKVLPRQVPGFNASGGYVLTAEQTAQDTMIRAGYWGLPMKLEQVAEALGLPFGKDPAGHKAMMKATKRKLGQEADPAVLAAVYRYCAMDVELERLIHNILPALPAAQVQEFILDAAMNDRGLQIDMARVGMLKTLSDREMARLDALMHNHSGGAVKNTRALADLKKHLTSLGEKVTDLAKADVAELLKTVKHPMAKVLLALRQEAAKTSTAKLTSMTNAVCADGGVRGVFQFYGATRTGRFCLAEGSPVLVKDTEGRVYETAIETVKTSDLVFDGVEWVSHEGVVFSGVKPVISYDGVVATREHVAYVSSTKSVPLQTAKESGMKLWGLEDVLCLPSDISEWRKLHWSNRERREGTLADPLRGGLQPEAGQSPAVQRYPEAREGSLHCGDSGNGSDEGTGAGEGDGTHRPAQSDLQPLAGWGDGRHGRKPSLLGAHEQGPEGEGRVPEESERGHSCDLSLAGHLQPVDGRGEVACGESARSVSTCLSRLQVGGGDEVEEPRSALHSVGPSLDTVEESDGGSRQLGEGRACAGAVGHTGPDATLRQPFGSTEAGVGRGEGPLNEALPACRSESGAEAENRRVEGRDVGEDEGGVGEKTCRTYDIVNAGPRNRFTVNGKVVSNSGRLIQPQNYPRPHLKRDAIESELAEVEAGRKNGDLMLVSSALRSCIVAKKDHSLVVVDFAQIEARVLAWIAGQNDILEVFATGSDVYTYDAKAIGSSNRTLGKVCRLGLGYGMGAARFVETAKNYGLDLTEAFAQKTVKGWRNANQNIVGLWHEVERLVTAVVTGTRGTWLSVSTCDMRVGCFYHKASAAWVLLIELPSGRHLSYRHPEYTDEDGVSYEGQDQYTKQWTRIRSYGAKFVENIVQAVARDLMLEVMLAADEAGFEAVGTVHDEGLWEVPDYAAQQTLHDIESIITNLAARAAWAEGLPMKGEGFVAQRYGK